MIFQGDCIDILKTINEGTVGLTFTSPPYYNTKEYAHYTNYEEYLKFLETVFLLVHRCTKEGRFLVVNTSPVIEARINRAHQSKRYGIPFDLHHILTHNGWDFIDDIIWEKPEPSVKNRNASFLQHRKPLAYKPNIVTEYIMVYRKHTDKLIDWNLKQCPSNLLEVSLVKGDYETSNIWRITPKSDKQHPAIFPNVLCEKVIAYYSFAGDIVLDPFAGSGTVGVAAKKLSRDYILIERNEKYYKLIQNKLERGFF